MKTVFVVFIVEAFVGKHFLSAHTTRESAELYAKNSKRLVELYDGIEIKEIELHD